MPSNPAVTPARDRIVEALRWGALTVEELASRVQLTPNGVRAQLSALQRDGMVHSLGVRPSGEAGKPPVLYGLTPAAHESLSQAYPPLPHRPDRIHSDDSWRTWARERPLGGWQAVGGQGQ